jgi:hypothetical protein
LISYLSAAYDTTAFRIGNPVSAGACAIPQQVAGAPGGGSFFSTSLEASGRRAGVSGRVSSISMPKVVLNEAAVVAGFYQIEATAVAKLVGMDMR